ncbi:MAG: flavin reductase family protein [Dehalococcoidales bacterium]|nr:flavin reductase family protein [Dehalococcoidales bacterium]
MAKIEVSYTDYLKETNKILGHGGLLLASVDVQGNPNAMTIGWGTIGIIWGKPVFTVLVRPSRYTYGLIETIGDFTVNVPTPELAEKVLYFGTVSGRDQDKFKTKGFTATPGRKVKSPIIEECAIHYECRVVHKNDVIPEELADEIHNSAYRQGDFHKIYFGEILAVYADDDAKKKLV